MSAPLHAIVETVELGEHERALVLLVEAEWEAFQRGGRVAGDLAYVRTRLAGGDADGALALLHQLVEVRG